MIRKLLAMLALAGAFGAVPGAFAEPVHPYVIYSVRDFVHTRTDDREVITEIFLRGDNYIGFGYREKVLGSIEPVVRTVAFSNEYKGKATPEEQAQLLRALRDAKVFSLVSDLYQEHYEYSANLDVRIGQRHKRLSFHTRPTSADRAAIDRILRDFARHFKLDEPADATEAVSISEGDHQAAAHVTFGDLLSQPDRYDGKRVLVEGYYEGEFEGERFCTDKASALGHVYKACIWYGQPSAFADPEDLKAQNHAWLRVEGVFFKGPAGHMGMWPGEIQRLTRTDVIVAPE